MSFLRKSIFNKLSSIVFSTKYGRHMGVASLPFRKESNSNSSDQNFNRKNTSYLNHLLLMTSGYVLYKLIYDEANIKKISLMGNRRSTYNFVADVVETTSAAVVYIEIKDSRRTDFFSGKPLTISNGSGFVVKEDGLILTNAHVVTGKSAIIVDVHLLDGRTFRGTVEDIDLKSDLATVRISTKNLPTIKLGNSTSLRSGEFVIAIGSPLALSNTVTFGVISSTHRGSDELGLIGKNMAYLQTDAAITFGNSGGPLVNLDGEAIGINSMKVTPGISFAIPSDYAKEFLKKPRQMKSSASASKRRYMGITMLTLTPDILLELRQRNEQIPSSISGGVLVWKVIIGSPAYNGGLQPGDIVTQIDGKPIKSANDIYGILNNTTSRGISMTIFRQGQTFTVHVTPENLE